MGSKSGRNRQVSRDLNQHRCTAAGVADNLEGSLCAVEYLKPLLHVLHANAGSVAADARVGTIAHAYSVIGDFDDHPIALELAAKRHGPSVDARLQPVFD